MSDNTAILDILTANLSDPKLTEFPICAAGTYPARITEPPMFLVDDEGQQSVQYKVLLASPAMKHNSQEPWEQTMPLRGYLGLTVKGKMTLEGIRRNAATLVQAGKQQTMMTQEQYATVTSGAKEVALPQYVGAAFNISVSVGTGKNGQLQNNFNIVL